MAARQMQKVLWSKGVLLTPQHLQLQDRFLEDLLGFRLAAAVPYPWGFSRLEVDREALAGGALALAEAAGVMPDGLAFEMPRSDQPPPPKPLDDLWAPDQELLSIFLAIPEARLGGANVAVNAGEQGTRYVADVALRRDENTGLAEAPIKVARKNFRLLAEGEYLEGHSVTPVARVRRAAAGGYELDPRFVPPLLDLAASEYLLAVARRIVEVLAARSNELAATRRQRNQGLASFGVSDVANFWLLYTVNTHLPVLRHLYETRRGHPTELYRALVTLAGALTTFSPDVNPGSLPAYDHGDLGECMGRLDAVVRALLETVVPANHVTLPLRETEPSVYATALDQERYLAAPELYLAVHTASRREELPRLGPQVLKASSGDRVDRLIRQALPGLQLRHVGQPPGELPLKLDYTYFALDRSGPEWDAIRMAGNLAVYVPSELPEPKLELVVLLPVEE